MPVHQTIVEIFETQASDTPQAIAVVFEDQHLIYKELNIQANELAYSLRALGIGPETLVAICTERSVELIVGMMVILKSGATYVPLGPLFPEERRSMIIEERKAKALLNQRHFGSRLPTSMINTNYLDAEKVVLTTFSSFENKMLHSLPEYQRQEASFDCWTRKEAYIKAIGNGLYHGLNRFDVSLAPGEPARLVSIEGSAEQASCWFMKFITPEYGYVAALAVKASDFCPSYWKYPEKN